MITAFVSGLFGWSDLDFNLVSRAEALQSSLFAKTLWIYIERFLWSLFTSAAFALYSIDTGPSSLFLCAFFGAVAIASFRRALHFKWVVDESIKHWPRRSHSRAESPKGE